MALTLVSRCDATWPTSWPVSLTGVVVGSATFAPAGAVDAATSNPGAGLGFTPLGTGPLGG